MSAPKPSGIQAPPTSEEIGRFWERPPSFSFVAAKGDVAKGLEAFLPSMKYRLVERRTVDGPGWEIAERISMPISRTRVQKALWVVDGYTFLVDPEMVVGLQLKQIQAATGSHQLTNAVWERVSQTVMLDELDDGSFRETLIVPGQPPPPGTASPNPALLADPTPNGLAAALRARGIPLDRVFGNVRATVLTLDEDE